MTNVAEFGHEDWFAGRPIRPDYLTVDGGKCAGTGVTSYQQ